MSKPKVLVTRKWPAEVEAELKEKYDVTLNENDVALTIPELQEAFQNLNHFNTEEQSVATLISQSIKNLNSALASL